MYLYDVGNFTYKKGRFLRLYDNLYFVRMKNALLGKLVLACRLYWIVYFISTNKLIQFPFFMLMGGLHFIVGGLHFIKGEN